MLIWCYSNTRHRKPRRMFIYIIVWIRVAPRIQLRPHTLCAKHYTYIMQQKTFKLLKAANSRRENCVSWLKSHISSTSGEKNPKSKESKHPPLEQYGVRLLTIHCVSTELRLLRVSWLIKPFLFQYNTSSFPLMLQKILINNCMFISDSQRAFILEGPKKGNSNRLSVLLHSI